MMQKSSGVREHLVETYSYPPRHPPKEPQPATVARPHAPPRPPRVVQDKRAPRKKLS